jgi:hypothetical protein
MGKRFFSWRLGRFEEQFLTREIRELPRRQLLYRPLLRRRVWTDQIPQLRGESMLPRLQFRRRGSLKLHGQWRGLRRAQDFLICRGESDERFVRASHRTPAKDQAREDAHDGASAPRAV